MPFTVMQCATKYLSPCLAAYIMHEVYLVSLWNHELDSRTISSRSYLCWSTACKAIRRGTPICTVLLC